jgi:glycosyltransferase involved in cell wall biosynthesis
MSKTRSISIIVPFYNEEENVVDVYHNIKAELDKLTLPYEMIFIDDGSKDHTYSLMEELAKEDTALRLIKFKFNAGQTAAMQAGFDSASNEVMIPMDGDMQNDPADIPRLIEKIDEGYDVVSGWRKDRKDRAISRKLPSKIANKIISMVSNVHLHDYGCTLKAYRKKVMEHVHLYGEMHRFIPIFASWNGARVTEIEVNHRPRTKGASKYGINRTFKVLLDLITIKFLGSFSTKPIYFFGGLGMLGFFIAFICAVYILVAKIAFYNNAIVDPNLILIIMVMFIILAVQLIMMGIIAEVLVRIYHESQAKRAYVVEEQVNFRSPLSSNLKHMFNPFIKR